MSTVDQLKKRQEELEGQLEESRKEICRLTKLVQKMYSNISKMGLEETSTQCTCSSPSTVLNKSTPSGYICLKCAGH